jgi:tetratricopeptide (TPR) repeat protein
MRSTRSRRVDMKRLCLGAILVLSLASVRDARPAPAETGARATISEQDVTLPTYLVDQGGKNPRFYFGRAYQGAQGRVYPYRMQDRLTEKRVDKTYRAIVLENEYVKTSILPEIGGRIFTALDKTDAYDFIYRQTVVKPALIGMLGAWISGGVEWNVFHHHRASSFSPVDYALQENPDGSVTAWIGEIEIRHRMKWRLGISLFPGRSYIEARLVPYNRSPFLHSMLYFANAGVHANDRYQVIFPPSTEWVTQHAKAEFAAWPIAHENYNHVDFTAQGREFSTDGVDISWWKNNLQWISFFAYNYEDDWVAGYDHGKKAGTLVLGDHHVAPGKKFWTWGSGDHGQAWDKLLTDADGPELELMAGGYSDNEPDYSWLQPHRSKEVRHYFYPLREIGSLKNATLEAAVGLEVNGNVARITFNATSRRDGARVVVKAGEKVLHEEQVDISPSQPFSRDVPLPPGTREEDLVVSLLAADGPELVAYRARKTSPGAFPGHEYEGDVATGRKSPMPEAVTPPPPPRDIDSIEKLYLAGMRLEQFYNPAVDPMVYYEEALRRDADDLRVNTAVGILMLRKGLFEDAERHLRKAVRRATWNYTHPRDAEPLYYHGVALRALGRNKEAYDTLFEATWDDAFSSPAYYQLAEIAAQGGRDAEALRHLDRALGTNAVDLKALDLKAALLRKSGRADEALKLASETARTDLLDFWSRNEVYLAQVATGRTAEAAETLASLRKLMRDEASSYLELAADYGSFGAWEEAVGVVDRLIRSGNERASSYPLLYYYAGYASEKKGAAAEADRYFALAAKMPPDNCFPFQLEMIDVLRAAMGHDPKDAMAPLYLGNLLFDLQPEAAIAEWEKARALGSKVATVYRNLGVGYEQTKRDRAKAIEFYEKAVELNPADTRVIHELDSAYRNAQVPVERRLGMLRSHHATLASDVYTMPLASEIELLVLTGRYEEALSMMQSHRFRIWEGGEGLHTTFVDANVLRGFELLKAGEPAGARPFFEAAAEFPPNLEAKKYYASGRSCEVFYHQGVFHEAAGEPAEARRAFEKAVAERQYYHSYGVSHYYRGEALKKLGRPDEARPLFEALIERGTRELAEIETSTGVSFFAKFGDLTTDEIRKSQAHYLVGLGYLGLEDKARARAEVDEAARLDIYNLWAGVMRARIDRAP